jgi:hypothetical protein
MRTICFCSCVGLLVAAPALAQEVAPLVPKMDPPTAAEMTIQFHEALAKGLKAGGLKVIPAATVRAKLKLGVENAGCDEGVCLTTAQGLLGGTRFATVKVSAVGKNYAIDVRLYTGSKLVARSTGQCDICTMAEAVQTTVRAATDVGAKGEEPPTPMPAPAPIPTPTHKPRPTPTPKPTPGPIAHQPVAPKPPPPPARQWPLWPGIVAGAIGVVGLAAGIPLLAIDGTGTNCRGDARPDYRNCADLYTTKAGGAVFTTFGVLGLVGAAVFLPLHFISKPKERQRAAVEQVTVIRTSDGVYVGAAGRF